LFAGAPGSDSGFCQELLKSDHWAVKARLWFCGGR
jgi:hypothetical protein